MSEDYNPWVRVPEGISYPDAYLESFLAAFKAEEIAYFKQSFGMSSDLVKKMVFMQPVDTEEDFIRKLAWNAGMDDWKDYKKIV